jgi:uncharacterized protein YbjT (DUF2867 family)
MKRVVVLGGTGSLGRAVTAELAGMGHDVVVASRHGDVRVDVSTGQGLIVALTDASVVVDATNNSQAPRDVLVDGTARVLAAARDAGVGHYVGISIVGIDDAPQRYYRAKVEQERVIAASPVPWTLLRATQFHDLIPRLARKRLGVFVAERGFKLQPIHVREVAAMLARAATGSPSRRLPDVAGPEVRLFPDLVRRWVRAAKLRRPVLAVPSRGPIGAFLRSGKLCAPDRAVGTLTFEQWLAERYPT